MFSNPTSTELSLGVPCRAMAPIRANRVDSLFLLGSASVRAATHTVSVVRYHEHVHELTVEAQLVHDTGPVHVLCSSPTDPTLLLTAAEHSNAAVLWKLPRSLVASSSADYNEDDDENNVDPDTPSSYPINHSTRDLPATELDGEEEPRPAGEDDAITTLQAVATLEPEGTGSNLVDICWRDRGAEAHSVAAASWEPIPSEPGEVLTVDRHGWITQWDLAGPAPHTVRTVDISTWNEAAPAPANPSATQTPPQQQARANWPGLSLPRVAWDPHAPGDAAAVSVGTRVHMLDWRSDRSIPLGTVDRLPGGALAAAVITDLDYNPNKPHVLATAAQDGLLKFWDLRAAKYPLLVARGGHSHWISQIHYNPFHDQLILSTGTDGVVNLWRLSTISSAPLLISMGGAGTSGGAGGWGGAEPLEGEVPDDQRTTYSDTAAPNVRIGRFEHQDSVYAASWSAADAWTYMSVGYDGRAVLTHVPSKEKYKILL